MHPNKNNLAACLFSLQAAEYEGGLSFVKGSTPGNSIDPPVC